jgi:hypothetical protein
MVCCFVLFLLLLVQNQKNNSSRIKLVLKNFKAVQKYKIFGQLFNKKNSTVNRIIITLISVLFFSCSNVDKKKNHKKINTSFDLVLKDSITINHPNLFFQDYKNEKLLLYNYVNFDVGVYNIENNSLNIFNKYGRSYDSYNNIVQDGLRFITDTIIGVGEIKGVKKYNFKGDYLGQIKVKNDFTYAPSVNFHLIDSVFILIKKFQGNPSKREFYKKSHKLLTKKNINTGEQEDFAVYPNKNSELSNDEYYFTYVYDFYEKINKKENTFSFINSNDSNIFDYDISTMKLKSSKKLELENYNPIKVEFGKTRGRDKQTIDLYSNGVIRNYFNYDNREIVLYNEGLDESYVIDFFKNNDEYSVPKMIFWINIMDEREKVSNDIKIPYELGYPVHMKSKNQLIFKKHNNKQDELKGVSKFYYVDIIKRN